MTKYRRINFGKNKPKKTSSPWLWLILALASLCVLWVGK